ncbi:MAG: hypothetical protein IKM61_08535 [Eubacteriaceae bacterium]|nr:hypothetical protein [Eubacteriaceae bacterium]
MTERKNAGYTIIQSLRVGNAEFVIGHNPRASAPYVTWQCRDGASYFWGHYFMEKHHAERDLLKRAGRELDVADMPVRKSKGGRER